MSLLSKLSRSSAVRVTCVYLAVFAGSILVLGAAIYFGVSLVWEAKIRDRVELELGQLMADYGDNGLAGLGQAIQSRAGERNEEGFVYLLQGADDTILSGQLPATPVVRGWQEIHPPWVDEDEPFLASGQVLPDGTYLLVGHDALDLHEMLDFVGEGLAWSLSVALPLALIGSFIVSTVTLRRVDAINRALYKIRGGDLTRRIFLTGSDDEFDRLAGNLNSMLDGIESLTDGLRQVSRDIAHDLRTPLTRVRQNLEAVAARPGDDAAVLARSLDDIDRLLDAFNALLRIAQIESGTRKKAFQSFDLSETLAETVEDFTDVCAERGKVITAEIDNGVAITGDRSLIVQMVVNLLENAICHTPPGSAIWLRLTRERGTPEMVVADNGPGIPETARDKVLRRFFRADPSRQSPGSGLGLSLVSAVAKLHGIALELADNRPGLKVVLSFPTR